MKGEGAGDSGLIVKHLRKSYKKRVVIRDVSLNVHRGEVVALLGPNGSGKSNLLEGLRWVMGENRPTAIQIAGVSSNVAISRPVVAERNASGTVTESGATNRMALKSFSFNALVTCSTRNGSTP